jgi:hypothetical protein
MIERNKTGPLDRRYDDFRTQECNRNDAHPLNLGNHLKLIMNSPFGIAPHDSNVTRTTTRR